jgi:hypothetical protein
MKWKILDVNGDSQRDKFRKEYCMNFNHSIGEDCEDGEIIAVLCFFHPETCLDDRGVSFDNGH